MKRIIMTDHFKQHLDREFFDEFSDADVVTAYSNEEVLKLHRAARADLILTELYGSGMSGTGLCAVLREEAGLRGVSIVLFCRDNDVEREACGRSKANAVLTYPVQRTVLRDLLRKFLNVPPRRTLATAFSAIQPGRSTAIACRIENISVTGMLIETNVDLRRGEKLHCRLPLSSSTVVAAIAEVVRPAQIVPGTGMLRYGMRFSGLDPSNRQAIERVVFGPQTA